MDLPQNITLFETEAALATGAAQAIERGYTHAIVPALNIPSDEADFSALWRASAEHPAAMILGYCGNARPRRGLDLLFFRLETGLRLKDPYGHRVYPLRLMVLLAGDGNRQMDAIETLVRAAWAGCPIVQIPIAGESSRKSRMTFREFATHLRLLARALSGWPNPKYDSGIVHPPKQPFWRQFWRWLNPFSAWRELRQGGVSRNDMAVGLAAGAFIGNMPVWGFHTVISLYVAKRLHLNPLAVMTGSHVSAPPMGPALVFSAMWIGHVIMHGERPKTATYAFLHGHFWSRVLPLLLEWTLGAILIGSALAIIVYLVSNFLFRFVERPVADAASGPETPVESKNADAVLQRV